MHRLRPFLVLAAAAWLLTISAGADPVKFARYPHISNDGKIAFSYHGDLWITDREGAAPRRLTAHIARDTFPRFSPDGLWIAFDSDRMGNQDVWLVPVEGGEPKRLTRHSTGDHTLYWTPDGKGVVIATNRGAHPWGSPLYIAPVDGSLPMPLPMDRAAAGMIRQDGGMVAFNRLGFKYWRKHYRGNNNTDIWVQDLDSKGIRQLTDLDLKDFRNHRQDALPMWGADGMIYFVSERSGVFNIWKIAHNWGDPVQVTRHARDGVQFPAISPDGKTIVYENEFELWRLDLPDGEPRRLALNFAFDPKENRIEYLSCEGLADDFSPAPDGERVAVEYHGEIFIVPVDPETGEKARVTESAWRDRVEAWSPDGKQLAYITDESLEEEIWLFDVKEGVRRKLTDQRSLKRNLLWSPDGRKLLFTADNRIFLTDAATGETVELAYNEEGGFSVTSFSEDGRWLCYSRSDADLNSDVYLFRIEDRKEFNVTDHPARDSGGYLSPDGGTVVFRSDRDDGYRLFTVSLLPLTEDPEDPRVKAREKKGKDDKKKRDDKDPGEKEKKPGEKGAGEKKDAEDGKDDKAGNKDEKPLEVKVDPAGIDRRARPLTSGDSVGSYFPSKDGKTIYFTRSRALYSIPLKGGKESKVTDGSFRRLRRTPDAKYIFFNDGDKLYRLSLSRKKKEAIPFAFKVKVDIRAQWEQVFEEAWRVMKYRFYDEKMHGFDWDSIKARYKPTLAYVGENRDLYDLLNEMIGELNASHTGVSGPDTRSMERLYSTKHLGFELEPAGEHYRVTHVYRDGPADHEWLKIEPGDVVLALDGEPLRVPENYFARLDYLLNDYVTLKMARRLEDGSLGKPRECRIKPVSSLSDIKYEEWVHRNREYVDRVSGGKVGYVHIRSMSRGPLRRFEKEISRYWNKNGMIIDIRYNGGGNIDQELIDILERRPYEYWNYRMGGRAAGRRPHQAIAGPKVMLINWRSASDSEVTPQGFRDLGLGRIVGNPTYGAVIATGSHRLLNGASIRTPGSLVTTYDPTKPHNYGINLENFGVAPDVWVENRPEDELSGFDRELDAAVKEALRMLAEGTWQYGEDD